METMKIKAQIKTEARRLPGSREYIIIVGNDESGNEVQSTKLTGFTIKEAQEVRSIVEILWNRLYETATLDRLTRSEDGIMS